MSFCRNCIKKARLFQDELLFCRFICNRLFAAEIFKRKLYRAVGYFAYALYYFFGLFAHVVANPFQKNTDKGVFIKIGDILLILVDYFSSTTFFISGYTSRYRYCSSSSSDTE